MAVKITITGKVHNAGYRLFLLEEADYLFIPYFDARNVKINGREALVVLVDGEKEQIEEFLEFIKSNKPENAVVEKIQVEEYTGRVRDIERFRSSFNTAQLSKIVQVGLKMLEKQDSMLQKQDMMLERQDMMLEKQDSMLKKQDETIKEIRGTREDLKSEIREVNKSVKEASSKIDKTNELLENRFERLEEEIEKIKKALIKAGIEL
ncbi:hypothetical protein Asulf_00020 [Archaeoglobus sulfaticallidus PM70-1]|uniref:acylphosphatase n=1 Tax=Archaeoglobus sulfaticallidus PM70-1 TaxID=387631 RepID=N0BI00_9EURY|nr:acylphosphatase [Archaeoglobus sulfaticallidus]AGK60056.1 hypothetical protein Asulf_00020 [Archaeoglobus sulfaticallidus PM70-1]